MDWKRFVNEPAERRTDARTDHDGPHVAVNGRREQPPEARGHRAPDMLRFRVWSIVFLVVCATSAAVYSASAIAQMPSAVPGGAAVSATVRPALSQVAQALQQINTHRWKAPNSVRDAADEDIVSIQRDLSGTLAGLLQQADAAPGSVPAAFAVYRNVDALYDTLLRVVETAELAAPDPESTSLEAALKNLEDARANLGDVILNGSETQQAELVRLRTAIQAAAAAQRAAPPRVKTTVIDDGPTPARTTHHRRTTSTKKPEAKPAQPTNPSQNSASHS